MFVTMEDHAEKYILNLSFIDNDISYWPIMNDLLFNISKFQFSNHERAVIDEINKCIMLINAYRIE